MRTLAIALLTGLAASILAFWGGEVATRAHNVSDMEGGRGLLPLTLEFEVRLPEGRALPDSGDFSVLMTSRGRGDDRRLAELRLEAHHAVTIAS